MVFIVGEFGDGMNVGASPTNVTPGQVITAAEAAGLGWMSWAWDSAGAFDMTVNNGVYAQTSDLTAYGQDVVLNPTYGLQKLAKPPTW